MPCTSTSPNSSERRFAPAAEAFVFPSLTEWQRIVVARGLRLVGAPYVWAGTSERPQQLFGAVLPGGFDCSGFVWRIYKLQAFSAAPNLSRVLVGRTSYAMSGEVARSARIPRAALQPGDVVFFGAAAGALVSRPRSVTWASTWGTTGSCNVGASRHDARADDRLYEKTFAWGRSPLVEAGLEY